MNSRPGIVFMGTPDFAVPSLRALVQAGFPVLAVVTQPDRPAGRGRQPRPSAVKQAAQELGLPVLQPERAGDAAFIQKLADLAPDVVVTAAYGQILPQRLLDVPAAGCLNIHASLLPRWRGAAPVHRAIMAGDEETGVTVMKMVRQLDAGPIVAQQKVPIEPEDDAGRLFEKLARLGAELIVSVLEPYVRGELPLVPQPETGVTYAERITREDEYIDWSQPVQVVWNHVRGLCPWPGATAVWRDIPVKVWSVRQVSRGPQEDASPGEVRLVDRRTVLVRCADGWLQLLMVQPSGKRAMAADDWFRGLKGESVRFTQVART